MTDDRGCDNGILGMIPGEQIGPAWRSLPDPKTSTLTEATAECYVERVGAMVRFQFKLVRPRRRGSSPFWTAFRADVVEP